VKDVGAVDSVVYRCSKGNFFPKELRYGHFAPWGLEHSLIRLSWTLELQEKYVPLVDSRPFGTCLADLDFLWHCGAHRGKYLAHAGIVLAINLQNPTETSPAVHHYYSCSNNLIFVVSAEAIGAVKLCRGVRQSPSYPETGDRVKIEVRVPTQTNPWAQKTN